MVFNTALRASIIAAVRSATRRGDLAQAEQRPGATWMRTAAHPRAMEALSWIARAALQVR